MTRIKTVVNKSCSSSLVFIRENNFQEDLVEIWPQKVTMHSKNALFLSACNYL